MRPRLFRDKPCTFFRISGKQGSTSLSASRFPRSAPRTTPTCSSNPKAIQSRKRQYFRVNHFAENALSSKQIAPCTLNRCPVLNMLTSSIWFDIAFNSHRRGPVAASELSHARLSGRRAMFFSQRVTTLPGSYLQFFATSLAQFASCVVHDWSGLRIVFCPTQKRETLGLKFSCVCGRALLNQCRGAPPIPPFMSPISVKKSKPTPPSRA
jgi:hypothetical protein